MWFNNALIFQYQMDHTQDLNSLLSDNRIKPCPAHARFIYGWQPITQDFFTHDVSGASLICMSKEERLLPKGVIARLVNEQVLTLEAQRGYPVKRAERAQIAEDVEFELLPKAFCIQKNTFALLDNVKKLLIINTSNTTQASHVTALLRKTLPDIRIEPLTIQNNLSLQFSEWIRNPNCLPPNLTLASDCVLFFPQDEKKRAQYKGYELHAEEIMASLNQGLLPSEISLIWNDRIAFTLTHELAFKKLKCLDYLIDEFHELHELEDELAQKDAALTLLSGELRSLMQDVLPQTTLTGEEVTSGAHSSSNSFLMA